MRRFLNRIIVVLLVTFSMAPICWADTGDAEVRPLRARVVTAGAVVRSGPAETYYLTDTLPEDTIVEIYRRQPDGWCAIRPPDDSFSWVYAQHVRPVGDDLAEINKHDVPARVGSRLSARRNVVQVRLNVGEAVEILGDDHQEGEQWYKIAPPAGEFRWVHARDLVPVGPDGPTWEPVAAITTVSLEQPSDDKPEDKVQELTAPTLTSESTTTWTAAANHEAVDVSTPASQEITPVESDGKSDGQAPSADLDSELANLELRFSRMVTEPTETWNVEALEQAAERLLSQADTVPDRDTVKATLTKIDRFAAIQRRHRLMHGGAGQPLERSPVAAGMSMTVDSKVSAESADSVAATRFDAVGRLRPVVSRRPGAPQFALVNDQGQVVSFLTPTPDLNLQPYLGRRIGVVGNRGYIPEFRRAHVTASRATPLSTRLLR